MQNRDLGIQNRKVRGVVCKVVNSVVMNKRWQVCAGVAGRGNRQAGVCVHEWQAGSVAGKPNVRTQRQEPQNETVQGRCVCVQERCAGRCAGENAWAGTVVVGRQAGGGGMASRNRHVNATNNQKL